MYVFTIMELCALCDVWLRALPLVPGTLEFESWLNKYQFIIPSKLVKLSAPQYLQLESGQNATHLLKLM